MSTTIANRANDFVNSIGVQAHVGYTDGKYLNVQNVISDLNYLGLDLVRANNLNPAFDWIGQVHYHTLAEAGIRFNLVVSGNKAVDWSLELIESFELRHPGAIAGIEGPNEINNWPMTYEGQTGAAAANAFQKDLFAAVKSNATLSQAEVFSFTGGEADGNFTSRALHPYPKIGNQPLAALQKALGFAPSDSSVSFTEFGYQTLPSSASGVDDATQARLILNGIFDAKKLGVETIYLYELLDAYADPTGAYGGRHYGLFDIDNKPKPVATAIHNLTTILNDQGAEADSFIPGELSYSISGLPETGSTMLLQKSGGVFDLVVWNEPDIWDEVAHRAIPAAVAPTVLTFGVTYAEVRVYDPLLGSDPIFTAHNASQITLQLTDHPLIVEVLGPAPLAAAGEVLEGVDYTLALGGRLNDDLQGSHAADQIKGGDGNDWLSGAAGSDWLEGGTGNDTLFGGFDADLMKGGAGNDTYRVTDPGDRIVELDGGGVDLVRSAIGFALPAYVENLELTGSAAIDAIGNDQDNRITGNAAANKLSGAEGDDSLLGGRGKDILYGGAGDDALNGNAGADIMEGGAGNDTYHVDNLGDEVIESDDNGFDRVLSTVDFALGSGIENLVLAGDAAVIGTGNGLANRIVGNSAANLLAGGDGADALLGGAGNDRLTGNAGQDRLTGGAGRDVFVFDRNDALLNGSAPDTVTDFQIGIDRIELSFLADGWTGSGALQGSVNRNSLSAALSKGAAMMAEAGADIALVVGPSSTWLFWDSDGIGHTPDSAVLLAGLAASDLAPCMTSSNAALDLIL